MASSPRPSLDGLPLDILCQVCEHLSYLEYDRQSLFSLSLVNRKCSSATKRERFSRISLTTRSPAQLASDVARLSKSLSDAHAYACVRRVDILVHTELCPDKNYGRYFNYEGQDEWSALDSTVRRRERDERIEAWGWAPLEHDCFLSPHSYTTELPHKGCRCEGPHETGREAKMWEPLVSLLGRLPGLTDIVVEGMRLPPRSILLHLHQHKPSCRLHMASFCLASQFCVKHHQKPITDDEYLAITSPCLYSVITSHSADYAGPHVDYNGEAIVAMLARYSPHLRHLWTERMVPDSYNVSADNYTTPRPPWRAFFPGDGEPFRNGDGTSSGIGKLDSLILGGDWIILDEYMRATDFSRLSGLHIKVPVRDDVMRELVRLGQARGLASLESLTWMFSYNAEGQEIELACELLACVPLLRYFCFEAETGAERVLSAVVRRHGQTLRTLCAIGAETSPENLQELQSHCPMLRQLMITLPRMPGDEDEARMYRTLGKLPHLERLTIHLAFPLPDEETEDPAFMDGSTGEERVEYLTRQLPQFAVDAELAKSMFRTVAAEQRAWTGKPSLERLCLRPQNEWNRYTDVSDTNSPRLGSVAEWTARSWVCRRRRWTDAPREEGDETRAQDLDVVTERCFIEPSEIYLKERMESMVWDGVMGKAWKALWPDAGDDWLESWSSIPILGSD